MKYFIVLLFFFCLSCYHYHVDRNLKIDSNNKSKLIKTKKELIYERMKSKDIFDDTIYFNDFDEYLQFIPDLKLPNTIKTYNINSNPDTIRFFLQGGRCNYGPSTCVPLAKIERENFVSIIYSGQTSGDELLLFNYSYKGTAIDSFEIFIWEALGPMTENCNTTIDTDLNIQMKYSAVHFESYDSNDTTKIVNIERILKLSESGKIQVIKNKRLEK